MADDDTTNISGAVIDDVVVGAAFHLIEQMEGNVEGARYLWNAAFEEAERIDHNQSLGDPEDMDDWERAVVEQATRFDQAAEARKQFRVVKPDDAL
jgi:hypothetical protein